MMTLQTLWALSPLCCVGLTILLIMICTAWRRSHLRSVIISFFGLTIAFFLVVLVGESSFLSLSGHKIDIGPVVVVDRYTLIFEGISILGGMVCTLLGKTYFSEVEYHVDEFYMLLVCSVMGAMVMVSSVSMASLFVGLELMSVPLYGLSAYCFSNTLSLEAGIKYVVLSALATCFLLFGMALLYAACGSLNFIEIGRHTALLGTSWVIISITMMVVGLAFKLSIIPFHLWTPDVYEGAPMPVTAFIATVSKVAVFAALLRFMMIAPIHSQQFYTVLSALAIFSIIGGNLLALFQKNLKRIMGYSSIAHIGYLLIVIVAVVHSGHMMVGLEETTALYLSTYCLTALGAFAIMTLVTSPYQGCDAAMLDDYRGLFWHHPYQAASMSLMMISMTGIPLTAGFIGKFYVVSVAISGHLWWLASALVVGSAIGLYYYLRVMITLFLPSNHERIDRPVGFRQISCALVTGIVVTLLVWIVGLYPTPLINIIGTFSPIR